ncbi:MAG: hypothetical protein IKL68_05860 [Clostridia bacterium]|nr:hypothetical protein [Clostridia bacterium]
MLSKEQKEKLRKIHVYELASEEKKGKAIVRKLVKKGKKNKENSCWKEVEFKIPSTYEILEDVIVRLLANGFVKVERVAPANANCIVRVFRKLHHDYDSSMIFNLYGADVFARHGSKWTSESEGTGREFYLDYTKCLVGQWLYQDEEIIFDTEFVDFYLRVIPEEKQV